MNECVGILFLPPLLDSRTPYQLVFNNPKAAPDDADNVGGGLIRKGILWNLPDPDVPKSEEPWEFPNNSVSSFGFDTIFILKLLIKSLIINNSNIIESIIIFLL